LVMKATISRKSKIFGTIGLGIATASILWVLVNLIAFYLFGNIIIGEMNKSILFSEISLVTFGLLCFLADLRLRISSGS
jgi:hypothetical protein